MPPRANWKGYLRLSLVSCPIALYPASVGLCWMMVGRPTSSLVLPPTAFQW